MDAAWVSQVRAIVAAWNRASTAQREFSGDEVALAIGASPTTGSKLVTEALAVAELPGLLEATDAGLLTSRHVKAVLRELHAVELSLEQRQAVILMMLHRLDTQTPPRELAQLITRLVLLIDLDAAQQHQDHATRTRHIRSWATEDAPDGQALVAAALRQMTTTPVLRDLSTSSYRVPKRLIRLLQARDQTCAFPGCHRPASQTDTDHRTPWPTGRTAAPNLQCLCRHHHRAKQTSFTVETCDDGGYWWHTRGGWVFHRPPKGH